MLGYSIHSDRRFKAGIFTPIRSLWNHVLYNSSFSSAKCLDPKNVSCKIYSIFFSQFAFTYITRTVSIVQIIGVICAENSLLVVLWSSGYHRYRERCIIKMKILLLLLLLLVLLYCISTNNISSTFIPITFFLTFCYNYHKIFDPIP